MKMRKCFVLRQVEVDMAQVKKGDIFRLTPQDGSEDKFLDPKEWELAVSDAKPCEPEGNYVVEAEPVVVTRMVKFNY